MPPLRINKYLSTNGFCSRREADRLIEDGRVFVNNVRAKLGDRVGDGDTVRVVEREEREKREEMIVMLFHKPTGMSVKRDEATAEILSLLIDCGVRLYTVDALEPRASGLVLLTNDTLLAARVGNTRYAIEREFVVELDRAATTRDRQELMVAGKAIHGIKIRLMESKKIAIAFPNARPNDLMKLFKTAGLRITGLTRTRVGPVKLMNFPVGRWRTLTTGEVSELKKECAMK